MPASDIQRRLLSVLITAKQSLVQVFIAWGESRSERCEANGQTHVEPFSIKTDNHLSKWIDRDLISSLDREVRHADD
jgi:hypothetical protein